MARFVTSLRLVHHFLLRQEANLKNSSESPTKPAGELGLRRQEYNKVSFIK